MQHEILHQPTFSLLKVKLAPGEAVKAEGGAMVSMSPTIDLESKVQGGLLKGLKRAVLGGESFWQNTFTAREAGEVTFAPAVLGGIQHMVLQGNAVLTEKSAYLASGADVEVDTAFGGAKSFFSGEGFFLLKVSGTGPLWVSAFGAIHELDLKAGETHVVDTGHIVAFEESVAYEVRKVGGLKTTLTSGEGLVAEFTGPGKVWLQTRSPSNFITWLSPLMPGRQSGEGRGSGGGSGFNFKVG